MTWAPDYVERKTLKDYLHIGDNADDVFIDKWITTVSRNIDHHCGRQFGKVAVAEVRYFTPQYDRPERAWFASVHDVQDVTGLTITDSDGDLVDADNYTLLPRNAAVMGRPYERVKIDRSTGEIGMSALWGWNAVPAAVDSGVYLQGARLNARRNSPFGISGSPSEGGEVRLLAQLDPDFRTSLLPLQRRWWAA